MSLVKKELLTTIRNPGRLRHIFNPAKLSGYMVRWRVGERWGRTDGPVEQRQYPSYHAYLAHQRAKLTFKDTSAYDKRFYEALRSRLSGLSIEWQGQSVLCLAARQGTEVRAFRDLGARAIGVDLNPGRNNPLVFYADFQFIPVATAAMDVVYTNSLDHALHIKAVIAEIKRVLRLRGRAVVEVVVETNTKKRGMYEATWWKNPEDVATMFKRIGFELVSRHEFSVPWRGIQFVLERIA